MGVFTDAAPGTALLCRIKVAPRPHARMGATFSTRRTAFSRFSGDRFDHYAC